MDNDRLVSNTGQPSANPIDDVAAAVAAALIDPVDFPSLTLSVVPGDTVAVAVDRELPQVGSVTAAVIATLLDANVAAEQILVVLADANDESRIVEMLPTDIVAAIRIATHDPADKNALAYLAASAAGDPIYVNRIICDADFAIPIGRVVIDTVTGEYTVTGGVFPSFADIGTQQRLATRTADGEPDTSKREVDEAQWLLGARFTVQLISGAGDTLLQAMAGDIDSVRAKVAGLADSLWNFDVPDQAALVVAAIPGDASQQTWANVARAVTASARIVQDDGDQPAAIAICTDLEHPPGPATRLIIGCASLEEAESLITEGEFVDADVAVQLIRVLRHTKIYLLSQLAENIVEDLGMAYVADASEVNNLCQRHATCTLVANAQHAWPSLAGTSSAVNS